MKKFIWSIIASAFIMAGCSDSPEEVVQKWGNAIVNGDKAAADKLVTPGDKGDNAKGNEFIIEMYKDCKPNEQDSFKNAFDNIGKAEVNGDTAKITVNNIRFSLKKVDGKWKICGF